ncbi:MAG: DUF6485 family protein [Spirochaetia bacterium]
MDCSNATANRKRCTCTYPGCERHGLCCECISYHHGCGELPGCLFTAQEERTYDRRVAFFVSRRS